MKIVCLDGHTANPGDLSWGSFQALGDFTCHARTPNEQILERAQQADVLLTNKTVLDKQIIESLPALKYIGVLATGYNVVDLQAAKSHNITVTNVPAYSSQSVAQHVIAIMLDLARNIAAHNHAVHQGKWVSSLDFSFTVKPIIELTGKTLGIVGVGQIGIAVGKIAQALGMQIVGYHPRWPNDEKLNGLIIKNVSLDELFTQSDFVTLHCPLNDQTEWLINQARLAQMKPTAFLINTGRGPLIDPAALTKALELGQIAGAGIDVLDIEPPSESDPLLHAPNCILTPHIAWASREARERLIATAAKNLQAFQAGDSINQVN